MTSINTPLARKRDFYIFYNSNDAITGDTSEYKWHLENRVLSNINAVSFAIQSCSFQNNVYPINENNNVVRLIEDGLTDTSIALEPGYYTGTSFASALEVLLNANGANMYNVAYDSVLKKITIT